MAVDLNMDMGAIVKGFLAKQSRGQAMPSGHGLKNQLEAYKIAASILAGVFLISVIYIGLIYIPIKDKINKKTEELNKVLEMKNQLSVLDGQIVQLKKKLDKSKEEYLESLAHFGNSEDLGSLYQTVSTLAAKYNLVVLNVKEVTPPPEKPKPVVKAEGDGKGAKPAGDAKTPAKVDSKDTKDAKDPKAAAKDAAPAKPKVAVKEILVDVEIKGHYGEYIKFKEDLALADILLKINTESIMVKSEAAEQGSINVKLNLSTYAIDKKPFQGIITEKENEKTN